MNRLLKLWRKLLGWKFVDDYGAGDGDYTAAIQKAINDSRRGVWFSPKTYRVSATIEAKSSTSPQVAVSDG